MSPARYCLVAALGVLAGASILLPGACSSDTGTEPGNPTPAEAGLSDQDAAAENAPTTDAIEVTPDTLESSPLDAIDEYVPPAELAWLFDPELWTPLAAAEFTKPNCSVYEAVHEKLPPLALEWQGCGDGCEWADVTLGLGAAGDRPSLDVELQPDARGFLRLTHSLVAGKDRVGFRRLVDLSEGTTVGGIKYLQAVKSNWSYCDFQGARASTWMIYGGGDPDLNQPFKVLYGRSSADRSAWTWAVPHLPLTAIPPGDDYFDVSFGRGQLFLIGGGAVQVLTDMKSSSWTVLEDSSGAHRGDGRVDLAVWTDTSVAPPSIRGWTPDSKGVRTIIDGLPKHTASVGLSSTSLVGLMGTRISDYLFDAPQIWTTPRATTPSEVKLSISPALAAQPVGSGDIRTWGDYAVVSLGMPKDGALVWDKVLVILVHLPTWTLWQVDPGPGRAWQSGYALTQKFLHMVDVPASGSLPGTASRVYRLDLSKISQWAKPYSY